MKKQNWAKLLLVLALVAGILCMSACSAAPSGDNSTASSETTDTTQPAESTDEQTQDTQDAQDAAEEVPTIKIAAAYPLSGTAAEAGQMGLDGARLAVKHINDNGGIQALGGAKLELVEADTTSDSSQSKQVVERLLEDEDIVAMVGCANSAVMMPTLPVIEKRQVPVVTNCNAPNITAQGYKYVFSITHPGAYAGENVVRFIKWLNEDQGYSYKKVAIVYENSAFGISSAEGSRANAEKYGLEIVFDESFAPGLTDASAIVTAMKNSGAEVFIPATYASESKLFIETMKSMDYHPLIIGPVAWPSLKEALGDSINGILSTGNWNPYTKAVQDDPQWKAVAEEFEQTYGYFMTEVAGPNYQAIRVIAEALELTGSRDSVALRDTIANTEFKNTMMTENTVKFDENGQNINAIAVLAQWQDGVPVSVFPTEVSVSEFKTPDQFN